MYCFLEHSFCIAAVVHQKFAFELWAKPLVQSNPVPSMLLRAWSLWPTLNIFTNTLFLNRICLPIPDSHWKKKCSGLEKTPVIMTLNRSSVLHTGSCTKFLTEKIFNHQSTCKTCFWRIAFFPWFLYSYCFCHFYLKLGWIWEELKSECAFLNFIFVKFIFLYLFNQLSIQGLVRGFWSLNLKNIFFYCGGLCVT